MTTIHKHKCGHRNALSTALGGPTPNVTGCGYVWEHDELDIRSLDAKDYPKGRHNCPNCGIGPWCYPYEGPVPAYPAPARVAFGRIVRPAEDNPAYIEAEDLPQFIKEAVADWQLQQIIRDLVGGKIKGLSLEKLLEENPGGFEVVVVDPENKTISGFSMGEVHRPIRRGR